MPRGRRRPRAGAGKKSTLTVKSELRALDLLEFFDRAGRPCRVTEVAESLTFPQSSTSRLLSELATAGYLSYDRRKRTYRPTARTALLSARTVERVFPRTPVALIDALAAVSETPVLLTTRNESELNILYSSCYTAEHCFRSGERSTLVGSVSGQMILSRYDDGFIRTLLRVHNAYASGQDQRIRSDDFFARIEQARRQGYLIQPVADAVRSIGKRCWIASNCGETCCMERCGPHLVTPVPTCDGRDVVAIVGMHAGISDEAQVEFARKVRRIIDDCMSTAPSLPPVDADVEAQVQIA
mgnify:CR=1 FL=1